MILMCIHVCIVTTYNTPPAPYAVAEEACTRSTCLELPALHVLSSAIYTIHVVICATEDNVTTIYDTGELLIIPSVRKFQATLRICRNSMRAYKIDNL